MQFRICRGVACYAPTVKYEIIVTKGISGKQTALLPAVTTPYRKYREFPHPSDDPPSGSSGGLSGRSVPVFSNEETALERRSVLTTSVENFSFEFFWREHYFNPGRFVGNRGCIPRQVWQCERVHHHSLIQCYLPDFLVDAVLVTQRLTSSLPPDRSPLHSVQPASGHSPSTYSRQ